MFGAFYYPLVKRFSGTALLPNLEMVSRPSSLNGFIDDVTILNSVAVLWKWSLRTCHSFLPLGCLRLPVLALTVFYLKHFVPLL